MNITIYGTVTIKSVFLDDWYNIFDSIIIQVIRFKQTYMYVKNAWNGVIV